MITISFKCLLVLVCVYGAVWSVDLTYSDILTVTDDTRFTTLHPNVKLDVFSKVHHVKGKYIFNAGERITGDRLILNFHDHTQFTKGEDIEVYLKYPARGMEGATLTAVEVAVDLTSEAADAYFVEGGIDHTFAEILLTCNRTSNYDYEIFMYGY